MEKQKIQTKEPMKPNLANKARVKRVRGNISKAKEEEMDTLKITHAGTMLKHASEAEATIRGFGRIPVSRNLVTFR